MTEYKIPVLTSFNNFCAIDQECILHDISNIIKSGQYSQGEWVKKFEEKLGRYLNTSPKHVVALSSGTAALHIAVELVYEKPTMWGGQGVQVPATTFIATSNAVRYVGHSPIFVDIDSETWNAPIMDGIGVDLYGNPSEKMPVISDSCESLGATRNGVKCGTTSAINCLSFFENKPITTGGEGGALVLFNETLIEEARRLRSQGRLHGDIGRMIPAYNYRMTEIQALIGYYQLDYLDKIIEEKRRIHKTYVDLLGDEIQFQKPTQKSNPSWYLNCVKFDSVRTRVNTVKVLKLHGIETKEVFEPPSMQYYAESNSVRLWATGLCLPSGPDLLNEDINRICDLILEII